MRQMYAKFSGILVVFVASLSMLQAAPPDVPKEIKATPGQLVRITVKTDKKIGTAKNFSDEDGFFGELVAPTGQRQFVFQPPTQNAKSSYVLTFWTEGELEGSTCTITLSGVTPPTPPGPNPPGPNPPDPPTPAPKGFRVIFVYETSQPITTAMQQVMFGEKVRNYLDAKTVKGIAGNGYRRFDPDTKIDNERDPEIKALWNAAKPHITSVPCVIVATDGKVEIINYPSGEDDALTTFKKYGG